MTTAPDLSGWLRQDQATEPRANDARRATLTDTESYDADGNRVQATANGVTTNYVLDTEAGLPVVIEDADANNNELARYDYGDDLLRMTRSNIASYYLFDGFG